MNYGIVEYFGKDSGHPCGYCKQSDSSISHGMWAHSLRCNDYEDLINRGWRRSGKYCYKPVMHETCCPQYTIRCDISNVKLSKSQKKVIKRFNRYLITGERHVPEKSGDIHKQTSPVVKEHREIPTDLPKMDFQERSSLEEKLCKPQTVQKKAKEIRMQRKLEKLEKKAKEEGVEFDPKSVKLKTKVSQEKSIEDLMAELPKNVAVKFTTKLVRCSPRSRDFKAKFNEEYELYKKYQIAIHHDDPSEVTEKQFSRFLVDGPLQPEYHDEYDCADLPSTGLGAFHQQYFLDDKMVAVGVLDILPHCTSSVYFFYDPDYSFLSLGTYSALREIYFTRSLHRECERLRYYYMGFYIHSCPKMKYKGRYDSSYLACPATYQWVPIERCIPKLDRNKYSRLVEDENAADEKHDVNSAMVFFNRQAIAFPAFLRKYDQSEIASQIKEVKEYVQLVGNTATSMLLFRS